MGIRGFQKYMNSVKGGWKTVNIIEEMRKFERENSQDPVIVINLWTLSHHYEPKLCDRLLGCRLNEIKREFRNFLTQLRDNGAKLIFVFKKTQVNETDFNEAVSSGYRDACVMLDVMEKEKKLENAVRHFERNPKFYFPFNSQILLVMIQTAKNFGTIHGMDSEESKPTTVHVHIANENNAMAIIGLDTYYVFQDGNWKFWSDAHLNMETMTIREYSKEKILGSLNLTQEKSLLFETLAGGLYSTPENLKQISMFFKFWDKNFFTNISRFVNQQRFPLNQQRLNQMVVAIFNIKSDPKIVEDFQQTLKLLNSKIDLKFPDGFDKRVLKANEDDYVNYAHQILMNKPIDILPYFEDLRKTDMKPDIEDLVAPWIQRTSGILLKHQNDRQPRTLMLKESHDKHLIGREFSPILPRFSVPSLLDLVTGNYSKEKNKEIVKQILGIDYDIDDVPKEYLIDIIILDHLVSHGSLKMFEAEAIFQTIADVKAGKVAKDIKYPNNINTRAVRVSFLFFKVYFTLHSCLAAVGIKDLQSDFVLDNVYFQKIYQKNMKSAKNCSARRDVFEHFKSQIPKV